MNKTEKKLNKLASAFGVLTKKDKLPFGKYKGMSIKTVLKNDPGYLCWLVDNTSINIVRSIVAEARSLHIPMTRIPSSYASSFSSASDMDWDTCYDTFGPDPVDVDPFW